MKQSALFRTIIIIIFFALGYYARRILPSSITEMVYTPFWWLLFSVLGSLILFDWRNVLSSLGLDTKMGSGLGIAFLLTLPMLIGYAFIGQVNEEITPLNIIKGAFVAAFFEEVFFRGFLFGQLFRFSKWGFIPAVLANSIIFGIGHLYQGNSLSETLGVFSVTLVGGIWFAWLYIEWETLWLPIGLHLLMNLYWMIFNISDTALGGFGANIFRVTTIALSVYFTLRHCQKRGKFLINTQNLIWQRGSQNL